MNQYNVIIVGSGIAGQLVAQQLINQNISVLIIESGDKKRDLSLDYLNDLAVTGHKIRTDYLNRVRQVGGACNLWAGRLMKLSPNDLGKRDWLGLEAWPIQFDELNHYYRKIDKLFNIDQLWSRVDSLQYRISNESLKNLELTRSVWARNIPRFNYDSKSWAKLSNSSNVKSLVRCTVVNIEEILNKKQVKVNCVKDDTKFSFYGDYVVLACGGIENSRILLDSFDIDGNVLGNNFDNVGRYFMDHPTFVSKPIKCNNNIRISTLMQTSYFRGTIKDGFKLATETQKQFGLSNPYIELSLKFSDRSEKALSNMISIYKSGVKEGFFQFNPGDLKAALETLYLVNPIEKFPHILRFAYGRAYRSLYNNYNASGIIFSHHMENLPHKNSRIKLTGKKNILGCGQVELKWLVDEKAIESSSRLSRFVAKELYSKNLITDLKNIEYIDVCRLNDASHHIGGTRMSKKSTDGVVDENLKLWNSNSIFLVGSSVFPSSGHANPTFTIAALSIRLGEHLKKKFH